MFDEVIKSHPVETMNVCTTYGANPTECSTITMYVWLRPLLKYVLKWLLFDCDIWASLCRMILYMCRVCFYLHLLEEKASQQFLSQSKSSIQFTQVRWNFFPVALLDIHFYSKQSIFAFHKTCMERLLKLKLTSTKHEPLCRDSNASNHIILTSKHYHMCYSVLYVGVDHEGGIECLNIRSLENQTAKLATTRKAIFIFFSIWHWFGKVCLFLSTVGSRPLLMQAVKRGLL